MPHIQLLSCPACGAPVEASALSGTVFTCPACGSSLALTDWSEDGSILCRECGTPNSAQARYCVQCKAQLQAGCPMCYTLNSLSAARRAQVESRRFELERLLLQIEDPENHPMAIFYLEQYGAEAVEGLLRQLQSEDVDARYGAAHTLGQIGDPRVIRPLITALQDAESEVRFWAAAALGKLKAGAAAPGLAKLLRDPSKEVRLAAQEALEHIATPEAHQALEKTRKPGWRPF